MRNKGSTRTNPSSRADYFLRWDKRFEWVDEDIQSLILALSAAIKNSQSDIMGKPRGKYYCFYKGQPSIRSIFAALLLFQTCIKVRFRVDPLTLKDPQKWTGKKVYRNWFFSKGQEREFRIETKEQVDYAIKLIMQSYDLAVT